MYTDLVMKKVGFIVLLLIQAAVASRGPELVCASRPVEAAVSEDVTLLCHLEPSMNATNVTVEWRHERLNHTVHLYRGPKDRPSEQGEDFRGQTSLFDKGLTEGNLSLKLSSVRLSDSGRYRCSFSTEELEDSCYIDLTVGGYTEDENTGVFIGIGIGIAVVTGIMILIGVVFGPRTLLSCVLSCVLSCLETCLESLCEA